MNFSPSNQQELVSWWSQNQEKVAVRGGNSRCASTANRTTLLLQNLNQVRFFDPDDMVIGVEAGMTVKRLHEVLASENMELPANCWYHDSTVGSMVSCADVGHERLTSGGLRDSIIGMEYLDGWGRLVKSGGKVVKNVTGYDLCKMLLGSRGCLGIITSVNFKLMPAPELRRHLWFRLTEGWPQQILALHEQFLPLSSLRILKGPDGLVAEIGFVGNKQRCDYIEQRLVTILSSECLIADAVCPDVRQLGLVSQAEEFFGLTANYIHLYLPQSTRFFLQDFDWEILMAPSVFWLAHPIGGDVHIFLNQNWEQCQKFYEKLKVSLGSKRADLQWVRSGGNYQRLPDSFGRRHGSLMQQLTGTLDPHQLFERLDF